MFKEHPAFIKQAIAALDCVLIVCAFYVAYAIVAVIKPLSDIFNYWSMVVGFIGFYLYFAWTRSLFSVLQFNWLRHLFSRIVMIFLSAALLGAAILYIVPDNYNSRTLYILFASLSFIIIASEKLILKRFFVIIRRRNLNTTRETSLNTGANSDSMNTSGVSLLMLAFSGKYPSGGLSFCCVRRNVLKTLSSGCANEDAVYCMRAVG